MSGQRTAHADGERQVQTRPGGEQLVDCFVLTTRSSRRSALRSPAAAMTHTGAVQGDNHCSRRDPEVHLVRKLLQAHRAVVTTARLPAVQLGARCRSYVAERSC